MILDKQAALPSKSRYDIIIAGGGMVGLSLACALAIADKKTNAEKSQPLSILLVDNFPLKRPAAGAKKPPPTYHPSFDARSTALSLASIEIYQTMGLLPSLLQHAEAIRQIHVSDRGHTGSTLLDAEEQDKAAFG
jgi:2-polyprenyl-6-methoxyphenol hydroxylase-like FAD-dependent oxidoreductase